MNVVFIFSDSHSPLFAGCYGHPLAETPAIDGMARRGARFDRAYCNSPLCVPARACLFTGRYVFENGCWDNCIAWDGRIEGWSHYLRGSGVCVTTVGKLDFKPGADHGIERELLALNRSSLDIHSLYREDMALPPRWQHWHSMERSGPRADLTVEKFHDRDTALRAEEWLRRERPAGKPWVLNVNFTMPHPGWPCPPDLWAKWEPRVKIEDLEEKYFEAPERLHPYQRNIAHHLCGLYTSDETMRRGHAAYLAHCEMVDENVGRVLRAMEEIGILDDTLVMYSSDHGESIRAHRIWSKMNVYEDSIRIPLVMMGPGVAKGVSDASPVSHLDIFPTIAEAVGLPHPPEFRGCSLLPAARGDRSSPRHEYVLSECHFNASPCASYVVTDGRMKYVECVRERPMLFDLESDPQELHDLVVEKPGDPKTKAAAGAMRTWLCGLLSPLGVDVRAKGDQAVLRERMEREGTLVEEIHKRGCERRTDTLVARDEMIPEAYKGDPKMKWGGAGTANDE